MMGKLQTNVWIDKVLDLSSEGLYNVYIQIWFCFSILDLRGNLGRKLHIWKQWPALELTTSKIAKVPA